ncbi:MAG: M61 family metallopeptidase [Alcanivoracaceae bacterium]|nr:M61 family metallopeptidase [Alcanivoracaceae bacterium]
MKISLILLFISSLSLAVAKPNKYTLTITDASHHLASVMVEFNGVNTKSFTVKLPVWRTGKYKILDLAKNIRHFAVFDAWDNPLTWQKDDKNTWRIFVNKPGVVKVEYQIYANQLKERVSHIDGSHAFLDATGAFVYSESQRNKALTVKLNVPEKWQSVSGMPTVGKHHFKADNYDQLVDSPIESGIHHFDSIKVENQSYEIVIWGDGNFDIEKIKKDISELHYQAKAIWKKFPFKRYVFMYHAGDNLRGATEHVNSTIIQADRLGFYPAEKYRKIVAVTAHEFVHTWNVKSYRPAGITPYNYSEENYSDLFWMAEGTTSFYDNLIATRAGLFSIEEYLEYLADDIHKFSNKPGRKVMSLAESSFDTWLSNDANRYHNTTVSIYLKGSLVSWLLDKEIRELTNNEKSLDDLSYMLYKKFANNKSGYSSYDVKQILKNLTKHDFSPFWKNYVEGIKSIDFDELLAFYGLQLEVQNSENDKGVRLSLGFKMKEDIGLPEISILDADGPAWLAGLTVGDKIIAIDGYQVNNKNLQQHIDNLKLETLSTLHYFHQGQLQQTTIIPIKASPEKLKIIPLDFISNKQQQHFNSWTGQIFADVFKDTLISE